MKLLPTFLTQLTPASILSAIQTLGLFIIGPVLFETGLFWIYCVGALMWTVSICLFDPHISAQEIVRNFIGWLLIAPVWFLTGKYKQYVEKTG